MLPMNLTFSLSFKCNSRCMTCNIYKKDTEELTLEEWRNVFKGLGKNVFWATISGGEPFLRQDLYEIVCALYDHCRPSVINIPTNGILIDKIPGIAYKISKYCNNSQIVINVSIDDIEKRHDNIRGVPGNFEKAVNVFRNLKKIDSQNLSAGIHTVISGFNVKRIKQISDYMLDLNPDSYITEIAEERVELDTVGSGITPGYEEYAEAVDYLVNKMKIARYNKAGKITRAFRICYYTLVKEILKKKYQVLPCYAGFASAQVAPDGEVWMCCIKAESIGNLKDAEFDFKRLWFSEKAEEQRKRIKAGECYCPLANAAYTNMLHNIKSLFKAGKNFLRYR